MTELIVIWLLATISGYLRGKGYIVTGYLVMAAVVLKALSLSARLASRRMK